tara:strand:- start:6332 stop:6808 length:477 start_codon:yes stop_codon:yes gene_type:complete
MTLTDLHEPNKLIRMHYPGPYGFQAGIDGLDHTYEILCQFTQTCLASVRYWNDGRRAKARATRIVDALNDFGLAPATKSDIPRRFTLQSTPLPPNVFDIVSSRTEAFVIGIENRDYFQAALIGMWFVDALNVASMTWRQSKSGRGNSPAVTQPKGSTR